MCKLNIWLFIYTYKFLIKQFWWLFLFQNDLHIKAKSIGEIALSKFERKVVQTELQKYTYDQLLKPIWNAHVGSEKSLIYLSSTVRLMNQYTKSNF